MISDYDRTAWVRAITAGFAVDVAVAAMLTLLVYRVRHIDERVVDVRDTLRGAAANTADTELIPDVAEGLDAVLGEGLRHHLFLGRVLRQVQR